MLDLLFGYFQSNRLFCNVFFYWEYVFSDILPVTATIPTHSTLDRLNKLKLNDRMDYNNTLRGLFLIVYGLFSQS